MIRQYKIRQDENGGWGYWAYNVGIEGKGRKGKEGMPMCVCVCEGGGFSNTHSHTVNMGPWPTWQKKHTLMAKVASPPLP